jgi:hypothetical protein
MKLDGWDDAVPYLGGEAREAIEDLISEQGLPPPEDWTSYDVFMDNDNDTIRAMITTDNGSEFEIEQHDVDWSHWTSVDEFDWCWEIWDWIIENYPDVDTDSHYTE